MTPQRVDVDRTDVVLPPVPLAAKGNPMALWARWTRHVTHSPTLAKRVPARKPAQRRRPPRMTLEALEDRTLLSASVWTDKLDYSPGQTALINGSGFQANETVDLKVVNKS